MSAEDNRGVDDRGLLLEAIALAKHTLPSAYAVCGLTGDSSVTACGLLATPYTLHELM